MPANRLVVVTRPLAQAEAFARGIEAIGRQAVVFPLLDILPLPDTAPLRAALADPTSYALVAFVSPNAIDAAFSLIGAWPPSVPIAVMGEGSRQALAKHGINDGTATIFSPLDPLRTDSQTLLQALDLPSLAGKRVLIVRGETGREFLADALRAQGLAVEQVAAYRRMAPVMSAERRLQLGQLLTTKSDWVFTSSEALRVAIDQAKQSGGEEAVVKMQQQTIFCSHARIKESAASLGFGDIILTASGDGALLAALQSRA